MTRAKDELILVSRPEQSSFLRLIPEEMLVKEAAEHRMPKAKRCHYLNNNYLKNQE